MKNVSSAEIYTISQRFNNSIYRSSHLGWLDLFQLPDAGGQIFYGNEDDVLIGFQPVNNEITWLHSFYCAQEPKGFDLIGCLKKCLPPGPHSVYTISSHQWYSKLLTASGCQKCDEIIQFHTDQIHFTTSKYHPSPDIHFISDALVKDVYTNCESAFPPLWRLGEKEFDIAMNDADLKLVCMEDGLPAGYLLAAEEEDNLHILRIAVNTAYQNKGYAAALLRRLISICSDKSIRSFTVNTNKKNSAAVCLYNSLNFQIQDSVFPVFHRFIRVAERNE